jgi:hypothetical protein
MKSANRIHEANHGRRRTSGAACRLRSFALLCAALVASTILVAGCGYNIGAPFQAEIQSVHVPIFKSTSYRRNLEYQLTEAVQKEIQKQSHFKVVKEPQADTRLTGHIIDVRKERLGENGYDDPRELQMQFSVEVTWEDLRTGQILMQNRIPISPESVRLLSTADFAPELGQSQATATQDAIDRMARQIVQMMETPW